jgi:hypothetical protein
VTVERLQPRIDIENPRLAQKRARGVIEMPLQPIQPRLLFDLVEAAAHRILLRHSQQRRISPDRSATSSCARNANVRPAEMLAVRRQLSAEKVAAGNAADCWKMRCCSGFLAVASEGSQPKSTPSTGIWLRLWKAMQRSPIDTGCLLPCWASDSYWPALSSRTARAAPAHTQGRPSADGCDFNGHNAGGASRRPLVGFKKNA